MRKILLCHLPDQAQAEIASILSGDFNLEFGMSPFSVQGFELIILDCVSARDRSLELCLQIKRNAKTENLPVVFMTNGEPEMSLAAFKSGADDCIPWGADPQELKARLTARIRNVRNRTPGRMSFCQGKIELDTIKQSVSFIERAGENTVEVTPHEFRLFHYLIERESKIVSRQELMGAAWNKGVNVLPRTIDKHISSLRDKVKSVCRIESVRQSGYVLCLSSHLNETGPKDL